MIDVAEIMTIVGNHVPPYLYGKSFIPGETIIPYSGPYWDQREAIAAVDTFLNGKWITAGENVNAFEKAFSEMFNMNHSLMVNSGSSANLVMFAALKKYLGWDDDDEIILSPVAFPTSVSTIYQNRLKPVFADIEFDTLNFDLDQVEIKVTVRSKAIFLSPVLGNPPDIERLLNICYQHELLLILDNCDSLGSKWRNRFLNEYAVISSCSFYPAHHISIGEGGMVSTDDKELMDIARSIACWGRDCTCIGEKNMSRNGSCGRRFDSWLKNYDGIVDHKYVFSTMGYNVKPLDLQGAIGLAQLDKFQEIESRRKRSHYMITPILTRINGVNTVRQYDEADVCWFGIPFICDNKQLKNRLVKHLEDNKIQTRNYFSGNILLHDGYSFLNDYRDYPNANKVLDRVFFLGCAPHYGDQVFSYIEKVIDGFDV